MSQSNLATVLRNVGRLAEAETEHRAVLEFRELHRAGQWTVPLPGLLSNQPRNDTSGGRSISWSTLSLASNLVPGEPRPDEPGISAAAVGQIERDISNVPFPLVSMLL